MAPIPKSDVVSKVSEHAKWMFTQRATKLAEDGHDTMSINPLLMPLLFKFHGADSFRQLAELLLAGHLMQGHTTSFGKLIDEKIVPGVFGTRKLDKAFRDANPRYKKSMFDEIDHLVTSQDGLPTLVSLKTSRWTIQLTAATNINRHFAEILGKLPGHGYPGEYAGIVVGVTIGKQADMTDKYDILRGINRGADHSVTDLQTEVSVLTGRDFWTWLNQGETKTQDWILEGFLDGVEKASATFDTAALLQSYEAQFNARYAQYTQSDGQINWQLLLDDICG